jgi:hypothetical protein
MIGTSNTSMDNLALIFEDGYKKGINETTKQRPKWSASYAILERLYNNPLFKKLARKNYFYTLDKDFTLRESFFAWEAVLQESENYIAKLHSPKPLKKFIVQDYDNRNPTLVYAWDVDSAFVAAYIVNNVTRINTITFTSLLIPKRCKIYAVEEKYGKPSFL